MKSTILTENHIIVPETFNQDIRGNILFEKSELFDIDIVDLQQKDIFKTPVNKEGDHIEIHFELQGIVDYSSKFNRNLQTLSGRYSFFYEPTIEGDMTFIPIGKKRKSIGIDLSKEYLVSVFNGDMEILGDFWKNIDIQKDACWMQNGIIDATLKNILYEIQNCSYKDSLKSVYLQSKINEILVHIVSQKNENVHSYSISKSDIDRLYYACELIKNNFENPYTLKDLAKEIAMSESKLKRNFKTLFRTSVFQYLLQQRMCKAKELLLESDHNISEISDIVGYKNPTHFTFAFKKFYKHLPSDFLKNRNIHPF